MSFAFLLASVTKENGLRINDSHKNMRRVYRNVFLHNAYWLAADVLTRMKEGIEGFATMPNADIISRELGLAY